MKKAFAEIKSKCCSKYMQQKVEEHPDYSSKITNNPIELLEAVKVFMHQPVRTQYPFMGLFNDLHNFHSAKQQHNESLSDWSKRFKLLLDLAKKRIGTNWLNDFVKNQVAYQDETDLTKKADMLGANAIEAYSAYLFLKHSDQDKYLSLIHI